MEVMNMLRQNSKLCDVALRAGNETFHAHKVVLAAASPYFKAMFCTSGMKECEMTEIPLQGVQPCVLSMLIDFAYTSELTVSEMNVCSLLPTATMFNMLHIVEACCTFLEHQLDPSNCIGIADFAQAHGCHELYKKARLFIYEKFALVCQNEEFMQLSPNQLVQVIKRDELNVRCESEVYDAVLRWVKHDSSRRLNRLEQLLSAVRSHFLTPCFLLEQLQGCEMLKKSPVCKEYLNRIYQNLLMHQRCPDKCRSMGKPLVIYAIGGYLRHSLSNVESYNPESKQWCKLSNLPMPRSGVAACVVHGCIYVLGGRNNSPDGNMDTPSVDCFDRFRNIWRKCSDMNVPRNRVGCDTIDGMVYAVGGSHGGIHHDSVER